MKRIFYFSYGLICYLIFLGVFLYAIGFMGNFLTPTTMDGMAVSSWQWAIAINLGLLGGFAVQHSLMARPFFKEWWTRIVPKPLERSTYVLFSSVAMILLFAYWQPMGITLWEIRNPLAMAVVYSLFGLGWTAILVSTCLIDHFDLFGLRQVWLYLRGIEYTPPRFNCPGPYRMVRHPLYVGWIMTFWFTPTMTLAHLLFAVGCTAYILVAIQLEERDLIAEHGDSYRSYKQNVPMLIPRVGNREPVDTVPAAP